MILDMIPNTDSASLHYSEKKTDFFAQQQYHLAKIAVLQNPLSVLQDAKNSIRYRIPIVLHSIVVKKKLIFCTAITL